MDIFAAFQPAPKPDVIEVATPGVSVPPDPEAGRRTGFTFEVVPPGERVPDNAFIEVGALTETLLTLEQILVTTTDPRNGLKDILLTATPRSGAETGVPSNLNLPYPASFSTAELHMVAPLATGKTFPPGTRIRLKVDTDTPVGGGGGYSPGGSPGTDTTTARGLEVTLIGIFRPEVVA